jgi:hypothetical protein
MLAEAQAADKADEQLYGESSPAKLPRGLGDLKARQDRLREAMKNLAALEADRPAPRDGAKGPAIPTGDPDSRVLPAKQGGFAPGCTAVPASDADHGFILDTQVLSDNDEASTRRASVLTQRFAY